MGKKTEETGSEKGEKRRLNQGMKEQRQSNKESR